MNECCFIFIPHFIFPRRFSNVCVLQSTPQLKVRFKMEFFFIILNTFTAIVGKIALHDHITILDRRLCQVSMTHSFNECAYFINKYYLLEFFQNNNNENTKMALHVSKHRRSRCLLGPLVIVVKNETSLF